MSGEDASRKVRKGDWKGEREGGKGGEGSGDDAVTSKVATREIGCSSWPQRERLDGTRDPIISSSNSSLSSSSESDFSDHPSISIHGSVLSIDMVSISIKQCL